MYSPNATKMIVAERAPPCRWIDSPRHSPLNPHHSQARRRFPATRRQKKYAVSAATGTMMMVCEMMPEGDRPERDREAGHRD
jgi:hypothetical protein